MARQSEHRLRTIQRRKERRQYSVCAAVFVCAVNVIGCSGSSVSQNVVGPSAVKCQPTMTGVPATIGASGGEISARIGTTADCSWSVTTNASWLTVEPTAGQGEAVVTIHVTGSLALILRHGVLLEPPSYQASRGYGPE